MSILQKVQCMCPSRTTPPPIYLRPEGVSYSHKNSDNTNVNDWSIATLSKLNVLSNASTFSVSHDINTLDTDIAVAENISSNLK